MASQVTIAALRRAITSASRSGSESFYGFRVQTRTGHFQGWHTALGCYYNRFRCELYQAAPPRAGYLDDRLQPELASLPSDVDSIKRSSLGDQAQDVGMGAGDDCNADLMRKSGHVLSL